MSQLGSYIFLKNPLDKLLPKLNFKFILIPQPRFLKNLYKLAGLLRGKVVKERTWYKVLFRGGGVELGHSRRWSRHVTQVQSKKANSSHKKVGWLEAKGRCGNVIRSEKE